MPTVDLAQDQYLACAAVTLQFRPCSVALWRQGDQLTSVSVPDLRLDDYLESWCGGDWGCCIALRSEWLIWFNHSELRAVGPLERLRLDGYDPGGLQRVKFVQLTDEAVMVITEVSATLIDASGNARWQYVHGQVTAQFVRIEQGVAWFDDESDWFGINLAAGTHVSPG